MSDDLTRIAQLEAEIDTARTQTIPSPSIEPDHRFVAALGRALLGLDDVSRYLGGALQGDIAEAANEIGTSLRRDQVAFEARVLNALARIEENLVVLDEIKANVAMIGSAYQDHAVRLTRLESMAHPPLRAISGG